MTPDQNTFKVPILTSWKEIARYMGKGVRTVQRWEEEFGLPVRRPIGSDKKAVLARPHDLDAWVAVRCASRNVCDSRTETRTSTLINRSALSCEMETYRMLRETNRTLRSEMWSELNTLKNRLAALCGKAA